MCDLILGKAEEKIPKFFWLQGVEDMAIWVALPEGINKREIKVILKPSHLTVKIRDETIIEGTYNLQVTTYLFYMAG